MQAQSHPAHLADLSGLSNWAIAANQRQNARFETHMMRVRKIRDRTEGPGNRGFSLMELLIVMSIITVTSLVSVPYFIHGSQAREARNEAEKLAQTIRLARFRAVTMNRNVYVHFEPGGKTNRYTAYANLGPADSVPTGTKAEVEATRIAFGYKSSGVPNEKFVKSRFHSGKARLAPDGGAITAAIDVPSNPLVFNRRGFVEWPDSLTSSWGTIYVRHKKNAMLVYAITVNRTGFVRVWTLRSRKKWS
jgi:prepilin-type N-terminal cleavage/methylation domain-containing protein